MPWVSNCWISYTYKLGCNHDISKQPWDFLSYTFLDVEFMFTFSVICLYSCCTAFGLLVQNGCKAESAMLQPGFVEPPLFLVLDTEVLLHLALTTLYVFECSTRELVCSSLEDQQYFNYFSEKIWKLLRMNKSVEQRRSNAYVCVFHSGKSVSLYTWEVYQRVGLSVWASTCPHNAPALHSSVPRSS